MKNSLNTPEISLRETHYKSKHFVAQMETVFAAFQRRPATMLMISIETGILRANICRYVSEWQRQGKIKLLKQGLCKISKHRAGYYTTDTNIFSPTKNVLI
jgi:hypothetical protein